MAADADVLIADRPRRFKGDLLEIIA